MLKRLLLYFSVVCVFVVLATAVNRSFVEKKKSVSEVIEETSDFIERHTATEESVQTVISRKIEEAVDPQFAQWFHAESAQVNSTSVDLKAKEKELMQIAKSLDERKIRYLQKAPLNPKTSQAERILSIYMLTLGGERAQAALVDIASQDLNLERAQPHTTDEVKNNQLRASQIMAVDAIAESQRELNAKMDDLQKIIGKTADQFVKNYAQRKRDELITQ